MAVALTRFWLDALALGGGEQRFDAADRDASSWMLLGGVAASFARRACASQLECPDAPAAALAPYFCVRGVTITTVSLNSPFSGCCLSGDCHVHNCHNGRDAKARAYRAPLRLS